MLMAGDLALQSLQRYNDSLVEFLRHKIIEHEDIFRWQVHELHRLYRIQKTLMEGFSWKEFKGCNSWPSSVQSNPFPLQDQPKYKLKEEEFISALTMVDPGQTLYQDCSRNTPAASPMVKPRPLDLQLPADDYISHFDSELLQQSRQGDLCSSLKEVHKLGNFSNGNQINVAEEVKLSLGAGKITRNQEGQGRCTSLPAPDVIDLDGYIGRASYRVEEHSSSISPKKALTYDGDISQFQVSAECDPSISARVLEVPSHCIFKNCAHKDHEKRGHESVSGVDKLHVSCPSLNKCKRKSSNLCKMEFVDLNSAQLEESSGFSGAPLGTLLSPAVSSSAVSPTLISASHTEATYCSKPSSDSDHASETPQLDNTAFSTLTDAGEKDNRAHTPSRIVELKSDSRSKIGIIDLESLPEDSPELLDGINGTSFKAGRANDNLSKGKHYLDKMDDSIDNPDFNMVESNLCKSVVGCPRISETANNAEICQESCEKSEEDAVSSSLCRSNVSQAGECFRDSVDVSQVTETDSNRLDVVLGVAGCACVSGKSCQCGATKIRDPDELQHQQEIDRSVSRSAVTLLHISLGSTNCCEYWIPDDGAEGLANKPKEKPQCSSDSFESIVLSLKDTITDDYCVTSASINANETETEIKGPVATLRRGRRLKDFQRDILPSLLSLSRHEICEDLHSIGSIFPENAFRKSRTKKGSSQNWFRPLRSRRSRFNYVS